MARHQKFKDACVRYLDKNGQANIEDICTNLKTTEGRRYSTRQIPNYKSAQIILNRDVRFRKVSMDSSRGARSSVYSLRKKGDD